MTENRRGKAERLLKSCVLMAALSLVSAGAGDPLVHAGSSAADATLSFQERVAAHRAVEEVRHRHRIWPDDNGRPKPSLAQVMPEAALRERVEDVLAGSAALEVLWGRPITGEQLQAEMNRMARETRDPARLNELMAALDHDPRLIAEVLARPALVDRLLRRWYATDGRYHAATLERARLATGRIQSAADLARVDGEYQEVRFERDADWVPHTDGTMALGPKAWDDLVLDLAGAFPGLARRGDGGIRSGTTLRGHEELGRPPLDTAALFEALPVGSVSRLEERGTRFQVRAILEKGNSSMRIATVSWRKSSFEDWWSEMRRREDLGSAMNESAEKRASTLYLPEAAASCAHDTWRPGLLGATSPAPRSTHTAVWTGSEMIVWGGLPSLIDDNTGSRYDPATDTWTTTSTAGAPAGRIWHTAVWTGTEMIVWGGFTTSGYPHNALSDGARYDPITDSWTPTTATGAPTARYHHTAVWTGTQMIVWDGDGVFPSTGGGRYDPAADSWLPVSTGPGAPSGRSEHAAVWTGSVMVIWGGYGGPSDGSRYDPVTDTWNPVSPAGAPAANARPAVVWTGSEVIVFGGTGATNGRYDPVADAWSPVSAAPFTSVNGTHEAVWSGTEMIIYSGDPGQALRYDPILDSWSATGPANGFPDHYDFSAIWTGTEMIVWGGIRGIFIDPTSSIRVDAVSSAGWRYEPTSDTWVGIGPPTQPPHRHSHSAVWTGSEMIVWGGANWDVLDTGYRNDPALATWTPTSTGAGVPQARYRHTAVWTGAEMIVWGGRDVGPPGLDTGGRYDPVLDAWQPMTVTGAPVGRSDHAAVWTGTEMIVTGAHYIGGRYDPAADTWTLSSPESQEVRSTPSAVWTGSEMIVFGGLPNTDTGGRYDPTTDSWTPTAVAPEGRHQHTAVWTGTEMLVYGSYASATLGGLRYDPATDAWSALPVPIPPGEGRLTNHTAVWTGQEMITWGGGYPTSGGGAGTAEGFRFDPVTSTWTPLPTGPDAPAVLAHTAVWTGTEMVVFGGAEGDDGITYEHLHADAAYCGCGLWYPDADMDGFGDASTSQTSCTQPPGYASVPGDCDEGDASTYPGAPQICDGVNNDCDDAGWPAVPADEIDGDGDTFLACGDCDDADGDTYPGAPQLCDGLNQDCDDPSWPATPASELDTDGDGFLACADCDDTYASCTTDCSLCAPRWSRGFDLGEPAADARMTAALDGGALVLITPASMIDLHLLRLDVSGAILWHRLLPGTVPPAVSAVEIAGGDFLVSSVSGGSTRILRVDPAGAIVWDKEYDVSVPAGALRLRPGGGSALIPVGADGINLSVLEVDLAGAVVKYLRILNVGNPTLLTSAEPTSDGGMILAGSRLEFGLLDNFAMKLSSADVIDWFIFYLGDPQTAFDSRNTVIRQDGFGGYFVAAKEELESTLSVMRLDGGGGYLWDQVHADADPSAKLASFHLLPDGTHMAGGCNGSGSWLTHRDAFGAELWSKRYIAGGGTPFLGCTASIASTASGSLVAAVQGDPGYDPWLASLDPSGEIDPSCGGLVTGFTEVTSSLGRVILPLATTYATSTPAVVVVDLASTTLPGSGAMTLDCTSSSCFDADGDGRGSPGDAACPAGPDPDCDDADGSVYPGAPQVCDGVNNDCDDPGWPAVSPGELDGDGDGFFACSGDCDGGDPSTYPGAPQICDGVNNDCDDPGWPVPPPGESDDDGDGLAECAGDCDDADGTTYPGAPQLCDGVNNDCDDPSWPAIPTSENDDDGDGLRRCGGDCDDTYASCTTDCSLCPARWARTFEGTSISSHIIGTTDGGSLLVHHEIAPPAFRLVATRMDRTGAVLWQQSRDGVPVPKTFPPLEIAGGTFLLQSFSGSDLTTLRLDASGAIVWEKVLPGGAHLRLRPGGASALTAVGENDLQIYEIDLDGNVVKALEILDAGFSALTTVEPTSDGGMLLAGEYVQPGPVYGWGIMKLDALDQVQWFGFYAGISVPPPTPGISPRIREYGSGSIRLAIVDFLEGALILEIDSAGTVLAERRHFGFMRLEGFETLPDDGYVIQMLSGGSHKQVSRYDASGNHVWTRTYNLGSNLGNAGSLDWSPQGMHLSSSGGPLWAAAVDPAGEIDFSCGSLIGVGADATSAQALTHLPLVNMTTVNVLPASLPDVSYALVPTSRSSTLECTSSSCKDGDGDGYGSPADAACSAGAATDCDDADGAIHPGATQVCDGLNNDCDDLMWPAVPIDETDGDGDTFLACADCDDGDLNTYPGAPQLCDGVNNDCDDPGWPATPPGESDDDGDGLAECAGDCDDANPGCLADCTDTDLDTWCDDTDCAVLDPATHPGAPEVNDGVDNQCAGDEGAGLIDELSGTATVDPVTQEFCWEAQGGATAYQVARSSSPDFSTDCTTFVIGGTCLMDPELPPSGDGLSYLARSLQPYAGSWGAGPGGAERMFVCGMESVCDDGIDDDVDGLTDCDDPDCAGDPACPFYRETFEAGGPGWTHELVADADTWHLASTSCFGDPLGSTMYVSNGNAGPGCITDSSHETSKLLSPVLVLPSAGTITLSFEALSFDEAGACLTSLVDYDVKDVGISTDGGATYARLNDCTPLADGTGSPLPHVFDISAYAGQSIQIVFVYETVDSVFLHTFAVDNVTVDVE